VLTVLKSAVSTESVAASNEQVSEIVRNIIGDVRRRGDAAVREYSERFDHWAPESFLLDAAAIDRIVGSAPRQVIDDIVAVQANVRRFAQAQRESLLDIEIETVPGVHLGQKHIPITATGAYVPGGRYPLTASAHMTIVTAKVAGVPRVAACTPPIRGEVPVATIAAMQLAGADEIYLLGGVQAVVALALGTETIERVNLIAGPGNAYVARPSASCSAKSASTCSPGRRRYSSSPMTTPTRSWWRSTC